MEIELCDLMRAEPIWFKSFADGGGDPRKGGLGGFDNIFIV